METSVSLLGRLAGALTDDDRRRLDDLYEEVVSVRSPFWMRGEE
jgi:hypothetical protein